MAKTEATRHSKRLSKVVTNDVEEKEDSVEGQTETVTSSKQMGKEDAPRKDQEEPDSQMDTVIEVKGSATTVAVSWDKKSEEGEVEEAENKANAIDQMMDSEPIISSSDAVCSTEDNPNGSVETKMEQEMQESGESQVDIVAGSTATVTVTWDKETDEGKSKDVLKEANGGEQTTVGKTTVKGKRKASSAVETSPSKKTKHINDGFCLYVGNLNNSKTFDEIKASLANFLMKQSLLVQDIRLDRSKKHAFVDLASEMDLTKGLTLNGELMDEKPMKIAKAKVKTADVVKIKAPVEDQKAKDSRCLFLKNVPYNATKEDILKAFRKAIAVRFPGGTEGPKKGIAFVEFQNKAIAEKVRQWKHEVKIQGRVLIVDGVGERNSPEVPKDNTGAAAPPNESLFVSNLPHNVNEIDLKKVFQKAVKIQVPKKQSKSIGYAFVEFAAVADAEKALQSSQNLKISQKEIRVEFCKRRAQSEKANVLSKTLIVMGLAEKTTAETLKGAFEGAFSARVAADKETGVSKRFGFVEFESEDHCKAVKEAMEDCEIDGSKVTVAFAKDKGAKGQGHPAKPPLAPSGQPAGQRAGKGRRKAKGKGRGAGTPQDAVKEVNKL
ncbi:nucleolin-like isoform X2 [Etheostoma cragini]|uniref:nucleolin-like isoform X2 n=1 Tax=Etheostoma cragini TaxID=417921 RepID=UPI00155E9693|nr:nucleolin-like isoform X2 [Etheostoma cragini]